MTGADFYADRINRGLSQDGMAEVVGVSVDVIRTIESGRRPQPANALRVAKFYGRTILELWPETRRAAA